MICSSPASYLLFSFSPVVQLPRFSEEEAKTMEEIQKDLEKKKKDVVVTDHAAMDYPPFRKNFYCEVS